MDYEELASYLPMHSAVMNSTTIENLRHLARFTDNREQWRLLSAANEWIIRMSAARNIYLTEDDLQIFVNDPHQEVRASVAICTKSQSVLESLFKDKHHLVRSAVIENDYVSGELLNLALNDSAQRIREKAQLSIRFPKKPGPTDVSESFRQMKNNEERFAVGILSSRVRETLLAAMDPEFPSGLPKKISSKDQLALSLNPSATPEQLKALTSKEASEAAAFNPASKI